MEAPDKTVARAKRLRRAMTLPEVLLWREIRPSLHPEVHFRRQHPIGLYVLDFFCSTAALAIEVDGDSHGMGDAPARDRRRDAWLKAQGVRVMRLSARDVLADPHWAAEWVLDAARRSTRP